MEVDCVPAVVWSDWMPAPPASAVVPVTVSRKHGPGPVGPVGPIGPVGPVGPIGPVGPGTPTVDQETSLPPPASLHWAVSLGESDDRQVIRAR